jgi:hypothetical protein
MLALLVALYLLPLVSPAGLPALVLTACVGRLCTLGRPVL